MKGLGRPISRYIKGRNFAAAAAKAQATSIKPEVQVTRLANDLLVATLDSSSPVSRVGVVVNAGSRFEKEHNLGVTHALRNAAGLSGRETSTFSIVRNIQQSGGNMTCSTTRDHMIYSLECLNSTLDKTFSYFSEAVFEPALKPHEVESLKERNEYDLAVLKSLPGVQMIEALHAAAYRCSLRNSLYMPEYMVGSHDSGMLSEFVTMNWTSDNITVVGVGVNHNELVERVRNRSVLKSSGAPGPKAVYHGGEIRIPNKSGMAHVAIVTEGAGLNSQDLLPVAVLQHAMGTESHSKYSSNIMSSKVAKAVAGATQSPFTATCINSTYTDSGLFGFQVQANPEDMTQVLQALVKTFADATKSGITDADVKRAKIQLKSALLMNEESDNGQFQEMCKQFATNGKFSSAQELCAAVDAVTLDQVQSIAKKVINAKPAMAAVGNLSNTPYLDQLL